MGGRGSSSGISDKGKKYGTEYHTVAQFGEIKAAEEANKNIIPDYLDELCLNWDFKNYYKND